MQFKALKLHQWKVVANRKVFSLDLKKIEFEQTCSFQGVCFRYVEHNNWRHWGWTGFTSSLVINTWLICDLYQSVTCTFWTCILIRLQFKSHFHFPTLHFEVAHYLTKVLNIYKSKINRHFFNTERQKKGVWSTALWPSSWVKDLIVEVT